jgi:hypothetical protein
LAGQDVERKGFAGGGGEGFAAEDGKGLSLKEVGGHEGVADGVAAAKAFINEAEDARFVNGAEAGMDDDADAGKAIALLFEELVVGGGAAEGAGEDFFNEGNQVGAEEEGSFAGEFFMAADVMEVEGKAEAPEFAGAGAVFEDAGVAGVDVEHDFGAMGEEGGEEQRRRLLGGRGVGGNGGHFLDEEVDVVSVSGVGASHGDGSGFGHGEVAGNAGTGVADELGFGGSQGLAAGAEHGAGDIEVELAGGSADADGGAGGGIEKGGCARAVICAIQRATMAARLRGTNSG